MQWKTHWSNLRISKLYKELATSLDAKKSRNIQVMIKLISLIKRFYPHLPAAKDTSHLAKGNRYEYYIPLIPLQDHHIPLSFMTSWYPGKRDNERDGDRIEDSIATL
jgi:hypothetical protein